MPKVYNKNKDRDMPEDAVYVGRPSEWGNLFKIGRDGTREEVIKAFEAYALERLKRKPDWLAPLRGKDLVCWCAPKACHADVLLRLANETSQRFVIRSNHVNLQGFRVVLCKGNMNEDGSIRLTWIGNKIINARTGERERVDLCEEYDSMDALLKDLETEDARFVYWQETREYQYINKK